MPAKSERITVPKLDSVLAAQVQRAEGYSKGNIPDPELFAMLAVGQEVRLDPGAKKHLGRRMALHLELIANPEIVYSPAVWEVIEQQAGWAIKALKRYRKDLSDLPQAWQSALHATARQYGDPEA